MLEHFHKPWIDAPICVIDFETTGINVGQDRAVQVGLARFEGMELVGSFESLVHPECTIPPEATAVHGITDEMVRDAPVVGDVFASDEVRQLLDGAQPAAYNASFDRWFVPPWSLADYRWPWLDALPLVRHVDRYAKGKGRHRLEAACERHGIPLDNAHSAAADAEAAGRLLFKLGVQLLGADMPLGELLMRQQVQEAREWHRFNDWLAKQPPKGDAAGNGAGGSRPAAVGA